jgi:hypothetical protein
LGIVTFSAGSGARLADVVGVLVESGGAALDADVVMDNVSFFASDAFVLETSKALVALGIAAGLAVVFIVLEVSGRALVNTNVVEDDVSLFADVAHIFFGSALGTFRVSAGDAGGNGEESLVESGSTVFDTGELSTKGEGGLAFNAFFGL